MLFCGVHTLGCIQLHETTVISIAFFMARQPKRNEIHWPRLLPRRRGIVLLPRPLPSEQATTCAFSRPSTNGFSRPSGLPTPARLLSTWSGSNFSTSAAMVTTISISISSSSTTKKVEEVAPLQSVVSPKTLNTVQFQQQMKNTRLVILKRLPSKRCSNLLSYKTLLYGYLV